MCLSLLCLNLIVFQPETIVFSHIYHAHDNSIFTVVPVIAGAAPDDLKAKPAVYNGEIAIRSMMLLNLTIDHQVVDGAPAAEFLQTVARYLENPYLIMS